VARNSRSTRIKGAPFRKLTISSEAYPVLCGSAFKNKGVQPMLDAVIDYLPSPLGCASCRRAMPLARRTRRSSAILRPTRPFAAALAFKGRHAPVLRQSSPMSACTRAKVDSGAQVINATKGQERSGWGKLFQMHSNKENPVETASARPHLRGDRPEGHHHPVTPLSDSNNQVRAWSRLTFPDPVIEVAHRAQGPRSDQRRS